MTQQISNLRNQFRTKRRSLSPAEQTQASRTLVAQIQQLSILSAGQQVALYLANDGELDPTLLIDYCWANNIQVYLPVLHPFAKGYLLFHSYRADTPMVANRYGIAEPLLTCNDICPLAKLDFIFTPLVAFDATGNRLGMGGGYYDRTLKPIVRNNLATQLIGLAHDCQMSNKLPTQPWDIPLNKIITPNNFFCI